MQNPQETPKLDFKWLKNHSPIFAKMVKETQQRLESEMKYRLEKGYIPS